MVVKSVGTVARIRALFDGTTKGIQAEVKLDYLNSLALIC